MSRPHGEKQTAQRAASPKHLQVVCPTCRQIVINYCVRKRGLVCFHQELLDTFNCQRDMIPSDMKTPLSPICAKQAPCKCCGASTSLVGVVDFHKNCEITRRKVLDVSGIPIYYYRCPECKFIFTTAFDDFAKEDFIRYIYNDEYRLVDPDYEEVRPISSAQTVANLFSGAHRPRRILDYGGGNGRLAQYLRAAGFPDVDTYDPFVPVHDIKPKESYECIVSFEVFEHTTDPFGTLKEMNELLTENGLILFSTLFSRMISISRN